MTLTGTVVAGTIVLDTPDQLPEGARVEVVFKVPDESPTTLQETLLQQAGCMTGLPPDMAQQHDHYIHGTPKR